MSELIALVDGSTYSASVCDHAGWAAQRLRATVTVAGKVIVFFTPCRSSSPVIVCDAPFSPPALMEVEVKVSVE